MTEQELMLAGKAIAFGAGGLLASAVAYLALDALGVYRAMRDGGCELQLHGLEQRYMWTLDGKFEGEREIKPPPPPPRGGSGMMPEPPQLPPVRMRKTGL